MGVFLKDAEPLKLDKTLDTLGTARTLPKDIK